MARFLIEKPSEETGKVVRSPKHEQSYFASRKEVHDALFAALDSYDLYNGLQITNLLQRLVQLFEESRIEIGTELEDQDLESENVLKMADIYKTMQLNGMYPNQFDPEINEFIHFLAMRHSKSLDEVKYAELMDCMEDDYNITDDKKSIWDQEDNYQPSSDEDEMNTEPSVAGDEVNGTVDELEQHVLLEKVDQVLSQVINRLPEKHKIRTLTQCMMPYLN